LEDLDRALSRARGDRVHQREEARLLLALGKEPARALSLAREGFAAQREPWDARVLLLAALAARELGAAQPVLAFLRENLVDAGLGFTDATLQEDAQFDAAFPYLLTPKPGSGS
jgi:hypothetical protein